MLLEVNSSLPQLSQKVFNVSEFACISSSRKEEIGNKEGGEIIRKDERK